MNILKKILEKLKNIFVKKEEIAMIEERKEHREEQINNFKQELKVKTEKKHKNQVETPICYGDGLGLNNKIEC